MYYDLAMRRFSVPNHIMPLNHTVLEKTSPYYFIKLFHILIDITIKDQPENRKFLHCASYGCDYYLILLTFKLYQEMLGRNVGSDFG